MTVTRSKEMIDKYMFIRKFIIKQDDVRKEAAVFLPRTNLLQKLYEQFSIELFTQR